MYLRLNHIIKYKKFYIKIDIFLFICYNTTVLNIYSRKHSDTQCKKL